MTAWWRDTVVYEVYPRSFADSDGDGVGDLRGLIGRLDHIASLGVGAVWLCPVFPSPQYDHGYDVSDYFDVDRRFGSLQDLDDLVAAAHARGIRVILDMVLNHTSHEHPWFLAGLRRDAPERDWYIWRPPRPGHHGGEPGAEPTNWGAVFGGSAWTWHEATGEYYLGTFSRWQPDLDWSNPRAREAIFGMLRWWRDRGIDGFRLDVINHVDKPDPIADGPAVAGTALADGAALCVNGPRLREYLIELRDAVVGSRDDLLLLGETPGLSVEQAAALAHPVTGPLDMVIQFEHAELDREPERWRSRPLRLPDFASWTNRWQAGPGASPWTALFLSNHDQARIVSRYGDDGRWRARSATCWATVLMCHRGTPFIYQGDEIGMRNFPFRDIAEFSDLAAHHEFATATAAGAAPDEVVAGLQRLGRDNARTPMQWDGSPAAGFTTGTPWLAINPDHAWLNVRRQEDDPHSVLAHYRRLVGLRRALPALVDGDVRVLWPEHERIHGLVRDDGSTEVLLVANLSGERADLPDDEVLRDWHGAEVVLSNLSPGEPAGAVAHTSLAPWEAQIRRRPARAEPASAVPTDPLQPDPEGT
ncbi:alpha-glucosidase [Agromyces sp. NPDC049794]|uniref:alpha-glucosidase n=1 Tax=unclassified Agromyces TaxID=2639701 RepID=UPI00340B2961